MVNQVTAKTMEDVTNITQQPVVVTTGRKCKKCGVPVGKGKSYCEHCKKLRYNETYKKYLDTNAEARQKQRTRVRTNNHIHYHKMDKPKCCCLCGCTQHVEYHHQRYRLIYADWLVVPMCRKCHLNWHNCKDKQ